MRVIVYVEGPSDKFAMEALLKNLIEQKLSEGILIDFFSGKGSDNQRGGNAKKELLNVISKRAINIYRMIRIQL